MPWSTGHRESDTAERLNNSRAFSPSRPVSGWAHSPAPPTTPSRSSPFLEVVVTQLQLGEQVGGDEQGPWGLDRREPALASHVKTGAPLALLEGADRTRRGSCPAPRPPISCPQEEGPPHSAPRGVGPAGGSPCCASRPALPAKMQGPGQKSDAGAGAPAAAAAPPSGI